jgi:Transmembrane protein of unknown function (DUF3556)
MGLLDPLPPPYDALAWAREPFVEKARKVCRAWALQGYGTPLVAYALYAAKVLIYIGIWWLTLRGRGPWEPIAFQKAILWNMLFEGLGLGCGSGPLTGRYSPPFGGFLYFLRPGTTRLPWWRAMGTRRGWIDVLLYAAWIGCLGRALLAAELGRWHLAPIAALLAAIGVRDQAIFLAARAEHYFTTLLCFLLAADWIPGAKAVQAALWLWAGVSKLNHHFPHVVCVMTSNSPFTRFAWLRKLFYRRYPDDLNPSRLAVIAHGGTLLEFAVPALLLLGDGGPLTTAGLAAMLLLHVYITSNVPMGVPLEWNVMMVYGSLFLFWKHAGASLRAIPLPLLGVLAVMLVAVPLAGNLAPRLVSFLLAMRYYAGNWAYSVWLFRGDSHRKLARIRTSAPWVHDQLLRVYDERTAVGLFGKTIAFRLMHLHGRALPELVPKAVDRFEDYQWVDGEVVAGLVLGWNFGDGHLHDERLLAAVQAQCGFEEGELRCIFVEAQPLGRRTLHWRIADAKSGLREEGRVDVAVLRARQPWGA